MLFEHGLVFKPMSNKQECFSILTAMYDLLIHSGRKVKGFRFDNFAIHLMI
jgi:hypothetical protein